MVLLREIQEHSDSGLIEECRGGDNNAFDELVRRYKDRIYNVVYRFVGNHEDAMDVAQEVFVHAYRGIDTYQGQAKVYTGLYSIAANLARNCLRDRRRKGRNKGISLDSLQESAPDIAQRAVEASENLRSIAEKHELDIALDHCIGALPDLYRIAFVLRIFEGLNYDQISISMECPKGTVKSRLNQARKLLRDCLQTRGAM